MNNISLRQRAFGFVAAVLAFAYWLFAAELRTTFGQPLATIIGVVVFAIFITAFMMFLRSASSKSELPEEQAQGKAVVGKKPSAYFLTGSILIVVVFLLSIFGPAISNKYGMVSADQIESLEFVFGVIGIVFIAYGLRRLGILRF